MTNLTADYQRSLLRALPVCGGKGEVTYYYTVRIPGGWVQVNHSFTEWAAVDFSGQAGKGKGDDSTDSR